MNKILRSMVIFLFTFPLFWSNTFAQVVPEPPKVYQVPLLIVSYVCFGEIQSTDLVPANEMGVYMGQSEKKLIEPGCHYQVSRFKKESFL